MEDEHAPGNHDASRNDDDAGGAQALPRGDAEAGMRGLARGGAAPARAPAPGPTGDHAALLNLALRLERLRALRYRKALECACDPQLAALWRSELADAHARAAELVSRLGPAGGAQAAADEDGDCLVEAMELAISNGDRPAAQAVARECLTLAEAQCAQVRARLAAAQRAAAVPQAGDASRAWPHGGRLDGSACLP